MGGFRAPQESTGAEQARKKSRFFHRANRAVHLIAQACIPVGARAYPAIGAATAEGHARHGVPPFTNDFLNHPSLQMHVLKLRFPRATRLTMEISSPYMLSRGIRWETAKLVNHR